MRRSEIDRIWKMFHRKLDKEIISLCLYLALTFIIGYSLYRMCLSLRHTQTNERTNNTFDW